MKTKFTYLLMIIMTMAISLAFTSCGDDDEEGPVGLWKEALLTTLIL